MFKKLKKIFKIFLFIFLAFVGLITCWFLYDFFNGKIKINPIKLEAMGYNIEFPLYIKDVEKKYNLFRHDFRAHSDLKKDTVLILPMDFRKINKNDSLDFYVYAYLFYIKNPSRNNFDRLKSKVEKQFNRKFEKRKFREYQDPKYYYFYMKINDYMQITLKPHDHELGNHFKIQKNNEEACVLGIYFNVHEYDVDSGNQYNGVLQDYQADRF